MRPFVAILVILLAGCDSDRIAKLQKENQELTAKLDATTKAVGLEAQEKCAKQAEIAFKQSGFHNGGPNNTLVGYTNHYNQKLNKCFIDISTTETNVKGVSVYRDVSDAFEGRPYADYMWINNQGKKYWEVKPFMCKVTPISGGEDKTCQSQDEFEALINGYMQN